MRPVYLLCALSLFIQSDLVLAAPSAASPPAISSLPISTVSEAPESEPPMSSELVQIADDSLSEAATGPQIFDEGDGIQVSADDSIPVTFVSETKIPLCTKELPGAFGFRSCKCWKTIRETETDEESTYVSWTCAFGLDGYSGTFWACYQACGARLMKYINKERGTDIDEAASGSCPTDGAPREKSTT